MDHIKDFRNALPEYSSPLPAPRVLIVDDDPDNLDFLGAIFVARNYKVETRLDSTHSLEAALEFEPDVILLDMMMPGLNGFEVCGLLKTRSETEDIPVMFISAVHQPQNILKAFEIGAVDYITKPFRVAEVIARVEAHMTNYRQRKEIRRLLAVAERQNERLKQEITRREKAETNLRTSEDQLRSITESASDAIISCDTNHRIIFCNSRAEQIFGYRRGEMMGQPLAFLLPETPEGQPFGELLGDDKSTAVHEAQGRDSNGRWLPVEVSMSRWQSDDGRTFFTAVIRDVTERKANEIARREQELLLNALRDTVALEFSRNLDLDSVLSSILTNLTELIPYTAMNIMLIDENNDITLPLARSLEGEDTPEIDVGDLPLFNEVTERMQLTAIPDVITWAKANSETYEARHIRSYMGIPIMLEGEVIGLLNLYAAHAHYFTEEHGEFLRVFANQAAIAIRNARRFEDAKVNARQRERQLLARELHDAVSQLLFSANVIAESLPGLIERKPDVAVDSLGDLSRMTRGALAEMRKLLLELRPTALRDADFSELLHHLGNALVGRYDKAIQYEITGGDCPLPEGVQIALYRIAQEALNNIVKHAQADVITLTFACDAEGATLSIADNGRGFDPADVPSNHFGLSIMRERAEEMGAAFDLEAQPDEGTTVTVRWMRDSAL